MLEKITKKRICLDTKLTIVSFTFDDAPLSSFTLAGEILEKHGFRGTYYVSAGLLEKTTEVGKIVSLGTIVEYRQRGHEIANHTYGHINSENCDPIDLIQNIQENKKKFDGIISSSFSYPYGAVNSAARFAARICTTSARGISSGINRGIINPMDLRAVRIYNRLGIKNCLDMVSDCATHGGWLIFYTHDVCDNPSSYGCTPEQFNNLVQTVVSKNLTVLTVQQVMERICM
ncbi:polysaccharide deacetylase family protein [Desulfobacter postgatei]|uniref:polysaccharide deacetylase family protein n=1 Tax=Desulfobacter postgatei TaxID=2293 RepID=UPI00259B4DB8|nr:polysaccharide deacetylase family protein [uncultured Desulfobacter sp.]